MTPPLKLTASILSADHSRLQEEIDSVNEGVDAIQADIMDGKFVKNTSFDLATIAAIKTSLPLDVHLMVEDPGAVLDDWLGLGATHISFHAEAVKKTADRQALFARIRDGRATAGIAINPGTPVSEIEDVIGEVDLVLIMSVEPGFGGQKFMPEVLEKVRDLRGRFPELSIQMDGGVGPETAPSCIAAGADNLVIGSALFKADNKLEILQRIRHVA